VGDAVSEPVADVVAEAVAEPLALAAEEIAVSGVVFNPQIAPSAVIYES